MYIYIAVSTIIVYLILLYLDEQRIRKQDPMHRSATSKLVLGFFAFIISAVGVHLVMGSFNLSLLTNQFGGEAGTTTIVENAHLKNIHQDVEFGLPKF